MKGPLKFRIKIPGDPTRDLPVTVFIDVKRGRMTPDDVKGLSQEIRRQGAHLVLILTDKSPHPDALEELKFIPQVILCVVEHRDLVKLLVVSLAKRRGINIDSTLLSRAYNGMFEKFGLRERITEWIERMTKMGYILWFEGFVGDTAKACRFFINSIGKDLSLEECWEHSWKIRNFLPFGIDSRIIPDMGLESLKKNVKVLKDYGFLIEERGKYKIQQHPSEARIEELLKYYGWTTTRSTLKKHFVFREAAERIFDTLIEHMERKLLIKQDGETVRFIKLSEVKTLREDSVKKFERKKAILRGYKTYFSHILTWKQRALQIISLKEMEEVIEGILSEIAIATDENLTRAYTFLVRELIDWYGHYVDKIDRSMSKANDAIKQLELEIGSLERKSGELLHRLINVTKATGLKVELQELQRVKDQLNEVKRLLETSLSREEIEKMMKSMIGDKKIIEGNEGKLITDVDEEMKSKGVRGDWTIAEYVLIKEKEKEMDEDIKNLYKTLDSFDDLSNKLINISGEISKLFYDMKMSQLKFTSILNDISRQIIEGIIKRPLFPSNVSTITVKELHQALDTHVNYLKKEREKAVRAKEKLNSLQNVEESFNGNISKIHSLETLYTTFWEKDIPSDLKQKKNELVQMYDQDFRRFKEELDNFRDFLTIERKSEEIKQNIEKLDREAQKLIRRYEELFEEIERYFESGLSFITRLQNNVIPKLEKSDKGKIGEILSKLRTLYEDTLTWVKDATKQILEEAVLTPHVSNTRTAILEYERNLRENLIKQIKDLDEESTSILMETVRVLTLRKTQWLSVAEVCEIVANQTYKNSEVIKKTLLDITEKRFLTLGIGF